MLLTFMFGFFIPKQVPIDIGSSSVPMILYTIILYLILSLSRQSDSLPYLCGCIFVEVCHSRVNVKRRK